MRNANRVIVLCCLTALVLAICPAATRAALFYNRQTFERGSQNTSTIDFEGLAGEPANFTAFPAGLSLAGAKFTGVAPGEPAAPSLFVIDANYHEDYQRGSGDVLSPGTTDGELIIELPAGTRAVGFDIVTFGGPGGNLSQIVASSGGADPILQFGTVNGPAAGRGFVGFTSDTPIARITVNPSVMRIVLIDNFRFGQSSPALVWGDANGDGLIDMADYTTWADNFLRVGGSFDQGDFDGSGIIDIADYTIWADNFAPGTLLTTAAPEPATLALAVSGGAMLMLRAIRRRRMRLR